MILSYQRVMEILDKVSVEERSYVMAFLDGNDRKTRQAIAKATADLNFAKVDAQNATEQCKDKMKRLDRKLAAVRTMNKALAKWQLGGKSHPYTNLTKELSALCDRLGDAKGAAAVRRQIDSLIKQFQGIINVDLASIRSDPRLMEEATA